MKKIFLLLATLLVWSTVADSQTYGKLGVGFIAGEPTGVSWKYRYSHENALEGAVGFLPDNGVRLDVNYLWHAHPFQNQFIGLDYGAGLAMGPGRSDVTTSRTSYFNRGENIGLGFRGVAGLNYTIPHAPLDMFVEAAPIWIVSPMSKTGLDTGFGMRVYF